MSLLERDEVPAAKSLASTRPTESPRVAASRATPAPTTPPPTTSTWCSVPASAASAVDLAGALSLTAPAASAITGRTLASRRPWSFRWSATWRGTGRDHHFDSLELLEVGVPGDGHGPAERADEVQRPVGQRGRAAQDLLQRAYRAHPHPGAARQVRVVRLAAPVVAPAGGLLGPRERGPDHHRVRTTGQRLGDVTAAGHPAVRDDVYVPAAGFVQVV